MKKNRDLVFAAVMFALASLVLAPAAQADHVRARDVVQLQEDLDYLDASLAGLNATQQERFRARIEDIRRDVTNLRADLNSPTWHQTVPRQKVADLRTRVAAVQTDVDRALTRRADRAGAYGRNLPAGTEVEVRLDQTVSSKTAKVEQRVEATTIAPVTVNGRTVVPTGTVVTGYVAEADDADRADRDGRLRLEFTGMQFPNGTRADIRSTVVKVEDRHTGTSTTKRGALGAILGGVLGGIIDGRSGAVVGAILGGGGAVVATRGQNVELPEGTHIVLRLDQATVLAMRE
jgi:hypothetical protein